MFHSIKRFTINLVRGLQYFKHGYNSHDWDYHYLMEDLNFKLKRMEIAIRNGYSKDGHKTADQIKKCVDICNRITRGEYLTEALKPVEERYGEREMIFVDCPEATNCKEMKFGLFSKANESEQHEALGAYRAAIKKADANEARDYNKLFDYIKNNIKNWWD